MHFHIIAKIVLVGASMFDASSSVGKPELNPLLAQRGTFTAGSAGIKMGAVSASLLAQYWFEKRHPESVRLFAIGNAATAGILTGAAIHNLRLK